MLKRKGQIVPRYLIPTQRRRHGHLVTFGCDVEISEGIVTALSKPEPAVVKIGAYHWQKNRHSRHARKECVTATWPGTTKIPVPQAQESTDATMTPAERQRSSNPAHATIPR
jgi:hypothetical protein